MGCTFSDSQNTHELKAQPHQLQLLATGTHAKIYRMPTSNNNQDSALKVIDTQSLPVDSDLVSKEMSQKFDKLKTITSDQLLHYEAFSFKDNKLSLLMEFAPFGTLQEKVTKNGRLQENIVSSITKQMLEGLFQLHTLGLIHKDLKPSNVLLFGQEKIKLSDYCIADIYDSRLRESRVKESLSNASKWNNIPYMGPEVVKNLGVTPLSDVWSLGCIVVYMLVGKRPWSELGSESQLFNKVTKESLPPLPLGITVACQHFLECCLSVVPSQRSKVQELLDHPFITKAANFNIDDIPGQNKGEVEDRNKEVLKSDQIRCKLSNETKATRIKTEHHPITERREEEQFEFLNRYNTSGAVILDNNIIKIDGTSTQKKPTRLSIDHDKQTKEQKSPQDSEHYVMLNNKKVKLKASLYKDVRPRVFSTQQSQWISPERMKMVEVKEHRKKMSETEEEMKFHPSLGIHSGFSRYEEDFNNESRLKMLTEPSQQAEKDYFKKPLKLIKKKIQQRKAQLSFEEKMSNATRKYSFMEETDKVKETANLNEISNSSVIGSGMNTYQELVIDTEVARAQRRRFDEIKKLNQRKREELKQKWLFQLNKGKQILKEELPFCTYLI